MPFALSSALIATAYLALSARALPHPNPAATYQVVDVGGPSSEAVTDTIYSTVIESSTPSTVTEPAITVTASPSAPQTETESVTITQSWTVVIGSTEQPAYPHSTGSPPLPTLDTAPAATPSTATETETVYNTVPEAPYAADITPSTTPSSLKGAFTSRAQWNHTVIAVNGPTSAGTGLMYAAVATGSTLAKRHFFAATGTGAYLAGRAALTGSGAYLAGRAAPTGTGTWLVGRAASTGTGAWLAGRAAPTGYAAQGWNATRYYDSSNDRLA